MGFKFKLRPQPFFCETGIALGYLGIENKDCRGKCLLEKLILSYEQDNR